MVTGSLIVDSGGNTSLGNKLFCVATILSLAWDNEDTPVFSEKVGHKNSIFKNLSYTPINLGDVSYYDEPSYRFNSIPYQKNIYLRGYFQSYKYFNKYTSRIQILLGIPTLDKFKLLDEVNPDKKYLGALHVRRGDYLYQPDHHPTATLDYYKEAIDRCPEVEHWIICSDDIDWCKDAFSFLPSKYFSEGRSDYEDIWLLSIADTYIIANSTFSWWSAWLSDSNRKKVIYPGNWFGPKVSHSIQDLIPPTWVRV
mgnify:CR=1 FL=1